MPISFPQFYDHQDDHGQRLRLSPHKKDDYAEFVDMMNQVPFSRFTLCTLGGLQRTIFMLDLLKPKTVVVCNETNEMDAQLGMKDLRRDCVW